MVGSNRVRIAPEYSANTAIHFTELRLAIQELWNLKLLGTLPAWTVGAFPSTSRPVSVRDINDLRGWVNQYEGSSNPIDPQGLVSLSFDPVSDSSGDQVSSGWANDAAALLPPAPVPLLRRVRSKAVSDSVHDIVQSSKYAASRRSTQWV